MSPHERKEILQQNGIDDTDIFRFRWRVTQVLCEAPEAWGALTDVELIMRARLHGYRNKELQLDFLEGKPRNVYKVLIDEVMTSLIDRRIATGEGTIHYGDIEMQKYRKGPYLDDEGCRKVTSIGAGDRNTFDKFFPPKS